MGIWPCKLRLKASDAKTGFTELAQLPGVKFLPLLLSGCVLMSCDDGIEKPDKSSTHDSEPPAAGSVQSRHTEAIVILTDESAGATVRKWFEDRGLMVLQMKAGFLVSGSYEQLANNVVIDSKKQSDDQTLSVPDELAALVESIVIHQTPDYQSD